MTVSALDTFFDKLNTAKTLEDLLFDLDPCDQDSRIACSNLVEPDSTLLWRDYLACQESTSRLTHEAQFVFILLILAAEGRKVC